MEMSCDEISIFCISNSAKCCIDEEKRNPMDLTMIFREGVMKK